MTNAAIQLSELEPETPEGERIALHRSILALVQSYEKCVEDVRSAYAILEGVETRMSETFSVQESTWRVSLRGRNHRVIERGIADDVIAEIRLSFWDHLVTQLELRRFLSIKRAKELDDMLADKSREKFPEITFENVIGFATGLRGQLNDMLEEAVEEVFNWLRPHRGSHVHELKTNTELEVGRKAILGWMVERNWSGGGFHIRYGREQEIRALENVFTALDGKGQITKTYAGALGDAIKAATDGIAETEYFRVKCFGNGNLHLEFKRIDLLDKFNAIAGGRRLRPAPEDE